MQEKFIELVDYGKIIETLKPGSHMPPMHLRHGHRYCLGYCSNMRTEVAATLLIPVLIHPGKLHWTFLIRKVRTFIFVERGYNMDLSLSQKR